MNIGLWVHWFVGSLAYGFIGSWVHWRTCVCVRVCARRVHVCVCVRVYACTKQVYAQQLFPEKVPSVHHYDIEPVCTEALADASVCSEAPKGSGPSRSRRCFVE